MSILPKLAIPPDQDSYEAAPGSEVLSVKLDGGVSRSRRDFIGAAAGFRVQWTLTPTEYQYLDSFFKHIKNGSLPFLIDLILDGPVMLEYTAKFVPGSYKLAKQSGLTYIVSAELEVASLLSPPNPTQYLGYKDILDTGTVIGRYNTVLGKWRTPPGGGFNAVAVGLGFIGIYEPSTFQVVVYETKPDGSPGSLVAASQELSDITFPNWFESPLDQEILLAPDRDYWVGWYGLEMSYAYYCAYFEAQGSLIDGIRTTGAQGLLNPFPDVTGAAEWPDVNGTALQKCRPPCVYLRTATP